MNRFAFESYPNNQLAGFHFDFEIPEISLWSSDKDKAQPKSKELQSALLKIGGVVEVSCHKQCIRITRGGAYNWAELRPKVIEVVKEFFGIDELQEVSAYA